VGTLVALIVANNCMNGDLYLILISQQLSVSVLIGFGNGGPGGMGGSSVVVYLLNMDDGLIG